MRADGRVADARAARSPGTQTTPRPFDEIPRGRPPRIRRRRRSPALDPADDPARRPAALGHPSLGRRRDPMGRRSWGRLPGVSATAARCRPAQGQRARRRRKSRQHGRRYRPRPEPPPPGSPIHRRCAHRPRLLTSPRCRRPAAPHDGARAVLLGSPLPACSEHGRTACGRPSPRPVGSHAPGPRSAQTRLVARKDCANPPSACVQGPGMPNVRRASGRPNARPDPQRAPRAGERATFRPVPRRKQRAAKPRRTTIPPPQRAVSLRRAALILARRNPLRTKKAAPRGGPHGLDDRP